MTENIKARFEVHELEGTKNRRIATPIVKMNKDGEPDLDKRGNPILLGGFTYEDKEVPAGWMVYFPNGSSIHVWTEAEMLRQGFLSPAELVDMETGDIKGISFSSLKAKSEQKERVTRSSKVHHV